MKLTQKLLIILFVATQLAACQSLKKVGISDQEKAYSDAQSQPALTVPADLNQSVIGQKTEVPPPVKQEKVFKSIPIPPGSLAYQIQTGQTPKSVLSKALPKPAPNAQAKN